MIMTKAVLLAKIVLGITHYASWNIDCDNIFMIVLKIKELSNRN